jgi:hypothetical protein
LRATGSISDTTFKPRALRNRLGIREDLLRRAELSGLQHGPIPRVVSGLCFCSPEFLLDFDIDIRGTSLIVKDALTGEVTAIAIVAESGGKSAGEK